MWTARLNVEGIIVVLSGGEDRGVDKAESGDSRDWKLRTSTVDEAKSRARKLPFYSFANQLFVGKRPKIDGWPESGHTVQQRAYAVANRSAPD